MDGLALTHPYHERKSCRKFGQNPPSGLKGDSMTDRWMDIVQMEVGRKNNIALAYPYDVGKSCSKFG